MNETHGEVIILRWDGDRPDDLFVRGHMTPAEAHAALVREYGQPGERYMWSEPVSAWGRWSLEGTPDGPGQILRNYDSPGRGRFPVMRARVVGVA